MNNNPVRTNPFGQIVDDVGEQIASIGSQAVKQTPDPVAALSPDQILSQILGSDAASAHVEQGVAQADPNASQVTSNEQLKVKQQEAQQRDQAAYQMHQQRLQEEVQYYQKTKQEEKQEELVEEQHEEQEKKQEIIQLKRERDEVWQQQVKAVQGSHEGQQGKM